MNKLFTSSGYVKESSSVDFNALPPFLRVLLTTDGTVTKSLESYFWEPVIVENLGQEYVTLDAPAPAIELDIGDEALLREVQLRGLESQSVFTKATSLIRTELLETDIRRDLENGKVGVGELLRELGLETYREIVEFGQSDNRESLWRRYRIIMNHRPFIQITEAFPVAVFAE